MTRRRRSARRAQGAGTPNERERARALCAHHQAWRHARVVGRHWDVELGSTEWWSGRRAPH
eukprot:6632499-Pyramimonas_sp.AAC.1